MLLPRSILFRGPSCTPFRASFSKLPAILTPPPHRSSSQQRVPLREEIYTLPNLLTLGRIAATPAIGYFVATGQFKPAVALLFVAGISDVADGYIARRYKSGTVLGSVLDPAADKFLMTTLVSTLAYKGLLPLPLAALILGRDVALSLWAFYIRYQSLPEPKTLSRYFSPSTPSAEVHPTQISKYNTFLQLSLVGLTLLNPVLSFSLSSILLPLQYVVGATTVLSGLSYLTARNGYVYLGEGRKPLR